MGYWVYWVYLTLSPILVLQILSHCHLKCKGYWKKGKDTRSNKRTVTVLSGTGVKPSKSGFRLVLVVIQKFSTSATYPLVAALKKMHLCSTKRGSSLLIILVYYGSFVIVENKLSRTFGCAMHLGRISYDNTKTSNCTYYWGCLRIISTIFFLSFFPFFFITWQP